jgi:very-short-patch-repair endonuclease
VEAVILYYGLRQEGIRPMLAWWDGKRTVDLAISRVRLNIEIDRGYESLSHQQAMQELESNLYAFRDGFTHIQIPRDLVRNHVGETVEVILRVMQSLREKTRVV